MMIRINNNLVLTRPPGTDTCYLFNFGPTDPEHVFFKGVATAQCPNGIFTLTESIPTLPGPAQIQLGPGPCGAIV